MKFLPRSFHCHHAVYHPNPAPEPQPQTMPRRTRRHPTPLTAARSAADPLDGPSGSLTLPDGRRLHVQTVSQAKGRDEGIKAADDAARKEGRDLGGWTGGLVWESGEILARTLMSCRELVAGQRCLELGTGCGLVGLTAGALGAAEAYLTDNVTFMAEANLQANFGGDAEALARIRTVRLRWGDDADVRGPLLDERPVRPVAGLRHPVP